MFSSEVLTDLLANDVSGGRTDAEGAFSEEAASIFGVTTVVAAISPLLGPVSVVY